jgi:hypothetical protein
MRKLLLFGYGKNTRECRKWRRTSDFGLDDPALTPPDVDLISTSLSKSE